MTMAPGMPLVVPESRTVPLTDWVCPACVMVNAAVAVEASALFSACQMKLPAG